jgi:hypothetical protein
MQLSEDKMLLGIATMVVMVGAWTLTAVFPALAPNFMTLVGALTGVYGVFVGGHVTNSWVQGKTGGAEQITEDMTPEEQAIADRAGRA